MKNNMFSLLLTGCIYPVKGSYRLTVIQPCERKQQYLEALKFYISKTKTQNIVYCDSSGAPMEQELYELSQTCGKNFEWLSFLGNQEAVKEYGKGYGEGEILEYVLKNSEIIQDSDYIIKVTGRLQVINLNHIIFFTSKSYNYFSYRGHIGEYPFVETRFFMVKKSDFAALIDCYKEVNDKKRFYLEHAIALKLEQLKISYMDFPLLPDIRGISGTNGTEYKMSDIAMLVKSVYKLGKYTVKLLLNNKDKIAR